MRTRYPFANSAATGHHWKHIEHPNPAGCTDLKSISSQACAEAWTRAANGIATVLVKIATRLDRELPIAHVFFERISTVEVGMTQNDAVAMHYAQRNICYLFTMESSAQMQAATSAIPRCEFSAGAAPIRDWLPCAESAARSDYRQ